MSDGPDNQTGETSAQITDEGIARFRERIGVVTPRERPFNEYATLDTIRHFSQCYGDGNPLYNDPVYGKTTRWGDMIAPPMFITTTGVSEVKEIRQEVRARGAHALAGVHEFFSGDEWEWFLPVRPGDRFTRRYYLYDVEEKARSEFTGKRTLLIKYRADYLNQRGELAAVDRLKFVRAERDAAVKKGKYSDIQRDHYTPEQMAEVDAAYANEYQRGSDTLYWEDVSAGDDVPAMVRGPFTLTDIITFMRGWGGAAGHGRLRWKDRMRHPNFYSLNEYGIPDIVQRVHWEDDWARKIGNPAAYDFGRMRSMYLAHLVTNWIGDDGWLWRISNEFRQFNYMGDIQWVKGTVRDKHVDTDGHHVVELDIWCENQRGVINAPGKATVILPSRVKGPVQLPNSTEQTEGTVPLIY